MPPRPACRQRRLIMMREVDRRPPQEAAENQEAGRENEPDLEAAEAAGFDEAAAADVVSGLELRMGQEVDRQVSEVKEQIARAFEHSRREQQKFGDQVRTAPELQANLGRFLEFLDNINSETAS